MNKSTIIAVSSITGAAIGFIGGFITGARVTRAQLEQSMQEEVDRYLSNLNLTSHQTPKEKLKSKLKSKNIGEEHSTIENMKAPNTHKKIYNEEVNVFESSEDNKPDEEELIPQPSPEMMKRFDNDKVTVYPTIMSKEEWDKTANKMADYREALIYFTRDDILYNETQEYIMPDDEIEKLLGKELWRHFGEQSNDPNVVYIRNGRIGTEFKITAMPNTNYEDYLVDSLESTDTDDEDYEEEEIEETNEEGNEN